MTSFSLIFSIINDAVVLSDVPSRFLLIDGRTDRPTDGLRVARMDGQTDGPTLPLIEMRERIKK